MWPLSRLDKAVNQTGNGRNLIYLRDLLRELVVRDMKLRYKRSVLGIAWSLLNPLAQLLVFSIVFRLVLPLNIPNYAAFLFTGLLAWTWFQSSLFLAAGANVFLMRAGNEIGEMIRLILHRDSVSSGTN